MVLLGGITDVGACEYINSTKTKGDFEDVLHTEHSNVHVVYTPCGPPGCKKRDQVFSRPFGYARQSNLASVVRPHCMYVVHKTDLLLLMMHVPGSVCLSVCLSVCVLVKQLCLANAADLIQLLLGI